MRQLLGLPDDSLYLSIAQVILERSIDKLRRVDDNVPSAEVRRNFASTFAQVGFHPWVLAHIVVPQREKVRRNQDHHHHRASRALNPLSGARQSTPHQQGQGWRRVNQRPWQEEILLQ